jgi:hypothetical protein
MWLQYRVGAVLQSVDVVVLFSFGSPAFIRRSCLLGVVAM